MTLHIGFTGTRHGMSSRQFLACRRLLETLTDGHPFIAHHGDCIGADADFHEACSSFSGRGLVVVHPGPPSEHSAGCTSVERISPLPHMKRNAAIVAASQIVIAAPFEDEPQPRGGTWATIGMARKAIAKGKLRALYVVGRSGELLDHRGWK